MGSCESRPKAVTFEELLYLKKGEKHTAGGCCPKTPQALGRCKEKGLSWPSNGEFDWGGVGYNCTMCRDVSNYGCECKKGIGGNKPTIVRTAYKGDPLACCFANGKNTVDGKTTCDPAHRELAGAGCRETVYKHCEVGDRLFTDNMCISWRGGSVDNANRSYERMRALSNDPDNLDKPWALAWCLDNPGKCDTMMSAYCKKYPLKEACRCINSKLKPIEGMTFNPKCVDTACSTSNSYRTAGMAGECKVNVLSCHQYNTMINTGVSVASSIKPTQSCNLTGGDGAKVVESETSNKAPVFDTSTPEGKAAQDAVNQALADEAQQDNGTASIVNVLIFILVFVVIVASIIGYYMTRGGVEGGGLYIH